MGFFSIKLHSNGSLDRYKARLVALGNKQKYGVYFEETFALVAKMTTVRTILAIFCFTVMESTSNGCEECPSSW